MGRLFLWLSGADPQILQACSRLPKSERTKLAGIGALVLVPAVLGLFSMMYAVSTITEKTYIFVAAGCAWCLVVLVIDRFLVSTTHRSSLQVSWGHWVSLVARYIFAIFVGIAVSHPFVLLWFDESIIKWLSANKREEVRQEIKKGEEARSILQSEALGQQLQSKTERRDCLVALLTAEQSGHRERFSCGSSSGLRECADRCRNIQQQIERINNEIDQINLILKAEDARNREQVGLIDAQTQRNIEEIQEEFETKSDYLARVDALSEMEKESPHIAYVKWFMLLFFVFIDILPITMKVATPMGEYEQRRDTLLFESQMIQEAERVVISANYGSSSYRSVLQARLNHNAAREEISSITQATIDFLREQERQSESFDRQFLEINKRISRVRDDEIKRHYQAYLAQVKVIFNEAWAKAMSRFHLYLEGL